MKTSNEHSGSNSYVLLGFLLLTSGIHKSCGQDFGYDGDKGPSHWGEQYNTCTGKHQSPININSLSVERVRLPPLKLIGFDVPPDKTNITNNGHTVMITLDSETQPTISGGPLTGVYEFLQLHFHWGDNDTVGSEDLIDGRSFPMELHMVFYKKVYRNQREALFHPDGLTVLAFFYEIAKESNPSYDEFSDILGNLTSASSSASFQDPPSLRDIMPQDLLHYYTYNGSLTTPPCSEVVTWIDFQDPIELSHDQLEKFRALQDTHGHTLTHNFRPIQPLGDRIVLFNTKDTDTNALDNVLDSGAEPAPPTVEKTSSDGDEVTKIEVDIKNEYETVDGPTEESGDDIDRQKPEIVEVVENTVDEEVVKAEEASKPGAKPLKGGAIRSAGQTCLLNIVLLAAANVFC